MSWSPQRLLVPLLCQRHSRRQRAGHIAHSLISAVAQTVVGYRGISLECRYVKYSVDPRGGLPASRSAWMTILRTRTVTWKHESRMPETCQAVELRLNLVRRCDLSW